MALSSELRDAVNQISSHAHQLRAILTIADAVHDIEALEREAAEAENRTAAAKVALTSVEADTAETVKALAKAKAGIDEANARAKSIVAQATGEGDEIKRRAEVEADSIIASARAGIDGKIATASKELEALKAEIAKLSAQKAELDSLIEAGVVLAHELENRADKARKYLAGLAQV